MRRVKPNNDTRDIHGGDHENSDIDRPAAAIRPNAVMEADGMYRVGIGIVPGTSRSGGKSDKATDCFWARLHSLNEDDLIDSGLGA